MRGFLGGLCAGVVLAAVGAAVAVPLTGPQEVSRMNEIFNRELLNYLSFTNPAETGYVALRNPASWSSDSIVVVNSSGTVRYIATQASP